MWNRLFDRFLRHLIRLGSLTVTMPDGTTRRYGPGGEGPPAIAIALTGDDTVQRLVRDPHLALGEAYMDGHLTIEGDDLHGFLELVLRNLDTGDDGAFSAVQRGLRKLMRGITQKNPARRSKSNVAHHYDLSAALYDLFLDADRQYSCAYFKSPEDTLEQAQAQKKAHIAGKLCLKPGMKVLDIGCGWGGMGLTLARDYGAEVLGVTLSEEQLKIARARAEAAGLADRVRFELTDYRAVTGQFDRIVSVGMFEHVGAPQFRTYFKKAASQPGVSGENFLALLERRLDNVVYRLGFAASRAGARQLVAHGNVAVNGKKLDIPSYIVRPGDDVSVMERHKNNPVIEESVGRARIRQIPQWLELDGDQPKGKVDHLPSRAEIDTLVNEQLIVEFYSK